MLWPCRTQSVPHTCALGQRRAIGTKSKTGQRRKGTNSGTKFCQQAVLPLEVRPTFKEIQAKTATEIHIKARYLVQNTFLCATNKGNETKWRRWRRFLE